MKPRTHIANLEVLTESITQIDLPEMTVRVWREEKSFDVEMPHEAIEQEVLEIVRNGPSIGWLARRILNLASVNAVEVKNKKGNGVVLYKDWP